MTSGERILDLRKRAGLTQAELALRAGVVPTVLSAYERGRREPGADTFLRLTIARTGDSLQGIKKGFLELADVVAVDN